MNSAFNALQHVEIPLWIFDIETGRIPWSNGLGLDYWGAKSVSELAMRDMSSDMSASVRKRLKQYTLDCQAFGSSYREYWTIYPKGVPQSAEIVFSPYLFPDGRPGLLVQLLWEKQTLTSDSLRSTQALMHTSALISLYNSELDLIYSNPAARSVASRVGMTLPEYIVHRSDLNYIQGCLAHAGSCNTECEVQTINGVVWHAMSIQLSRDTVTGESSILVSAADVTEQRVAKQNALTLAYTDSLTGTPNRNALLRHLDKLIAAREKSQTKFAVLYLDLDRFKAINDTLGHAVGDELLKTFALLLSRCIGEQDIAGRLAGDEFIVIIDDVDDKNGLEKSVRAILAACANPAIVAGHALRISPSIGICTFPDDATESTCLLTNADLAMYAAKRSQQQYRFFESEMEQTSRVRLAIENDIIVALQEDQFELYYQPKIGTDSGQIVGVEALIRWNHPTRGMVRPDEFISVAEETGQIVDVGHWVLNQGCADQVRWQTAGFNIPIAINISPLQFLSKSFVRNTRAVFDKLCINPTMVDLEITESVLIGDKDQVLNIMEELHGHGVTFSIDDFGTGYSNLAYLQKYPLDSLKIDKSFLDDISDTALLELILGMAKILNLKVVAEGVETIEQVEWLLAHDCDELQGYYFSRPVPYAELLSLLEDQALGSASFKKMA